MQLTGLGTWVCVDAGEALARCNGGSCAVRGASSVHGHLEAGDGTAVVPDWQDISLNETAASLREDVQQTVEFDVRRPHAQGGRRG